MRKYKVKFTEDAKQDLKSISTYIKNTLKEPYIAKKLVKKIEENIYEIANNADVFSMIKDDYINSVEIRKIVIDNYIVLYKLEDTKNMMYIVRVMYGKRNWKELLK